MKTIGILLMFISFVFINQSYAQIKLGDKLKRETNNRTNKNVDQGIDKTFDSVESGVKDLFKKNKSNVQDSAATVQEEELAPEASHSLKAFSQYDFVPGDKLHREIGST